MGKYRVRLISAGTVRLPRSQTITAVDHRIRASNAVDPGIRSGSGIHQGIHFTVEVEALDILASIPLAQSEAAHVADLLSAVSGGALRDPMPLLAFDVDNAKPDREMAQIIYDAPQLKDFRRALVEADFAAVLSALDRLRQDDPKSARRLDRAFRYLRQGMLESDLVDQFEDYWVGLEAINPVVQTRFLTSTTRAPRCRSCRDTLICKNCDAVASVQDNASGIDYVIVSLLGLSEKEARFVRGKRIQASHSTRSFAELLNDLPRAVDIARRALVFGVHGLLDLPSGLVSNLTRAPLRIFGNAGLTFVATLKGLSVASLDAMPTYPQIRFQGLETMLPVQAGVDPSLPHPPEADTDPLTVMGVQVLASVENFDGVVESLTAISRFESDATLPNSSFQTFIAQLRAPAPE